MLLVIAGAEIDYGNSAHITNKSTLSRIWVFRVADQCFLNYYGLFYNRSCMHEQLRAVYDMVSILKFINVISPLCDHLIPHSCHLLTLQLLS